MTQKPQLECTAKIEMILESSLKMDEKQPGTSKFIFPLSIPSNPPLSILSSLYAQNQLLASFPVQHQTLFES
jgi:hypothetical protein